MDDGVIDGYGVDGSPRSGATSMPVVTTVFGRSRTFGGLHIREWAFLAVSVINIFATIGLTIYRLVSVIQENPESPDFTFTILILINAAFCFYYVVHGVLNELQYEIYAVIAAVTIILLYVVAEYVVNGEGRNDIKLARLVCAAVLAPVQIVLSVLVAREFGWLEFRIVGASVALQTMYREASRFISLLKFDIQVAVSLVLLVLKNGTKVDTMEIVTLSVGIALAVLWAVGGWFLLRYEIRWAAWLFGIIGLAEPAYIIWHIFQIYKFFTTNIHEDTTNLLYTTLAAGLLALLVRGIIYVELYRIYKNFGHGLRERAFGIGPDEHSSLLSAGPVRRR